MSYDVDSSKNIRSQLAQMRGILFDLDGTLIETDDHWADIVERRLAFLGRVFRRLDTGRLARAIVMRSEIPANYAMLVLEHLGIGSDFFGLADRVRRARGLATDQAVSVVQGTEELLEALSGRYSLALVTTRGETEALAFLRQLDLARFFSVIITRQQVLRMKPHPEPVLTAAKELKLETNHCVLIGDTVMDMQAARRAGSLAIGVLSGFGDRQQLEDAGAHLILDRAEQVLAFLDHNEKDQE